MVNRSPRISDENERVETGGRARTWAAPELYLSHSEAQLGTGGNEGSLTEDALEDIQQSDVLTGHVIGGKYRILDLLGEGAMAVVYEAVELTTNRRVAAKTLKYSDESMVARFAREVEIHQKLKHENIVEAVECVMGPNNICLFIMEMLKGMDLEEILESQERIDSIPEYVSILYQICDGLEHAHRLGVIHRDLKPENIIVLRNNDQIKLKILDFGVAKIQEDLQKLTKTGVVLGSPAYMSPEQCMGKKLSERSDIYSLGSLAFELLTGELPYDENTAVDMMKAHCDPMTEPLSIKECRPDTPAAEILQGIINTCMHYDPEMRYKNINALKCDLNTWWKAAQIGAPGDPSPFHYVDPEEYERSLEEEKKSMGGEDLSQLSNLIDSQRKSQIDTMRGNFKEDELPRKKFDKKKLIPVAIGFAVLLVLSGVIYGITLIDFSKFKQPESPVVETNSEKSGDEAKSGSDAESSTETKPQVNKSKKRKIYAPGWTGK